MRLIGVVVLATLITLSLSLLVSYKLEIEFEGESVIEGKEHIPEGYKRTSSVRRGGLAKRWFPEQYVLYTTPCKETVNLLADSETYQGMEVGMTVQIHYIVTRWGTDCKVTKWSPKTD